MSHFYTDHLSFGSHLFYFMQFRNNTKTLIIHEFQCILNEAHMVEIYQLFALDDVTVIKGCHFFFPGAYYKTF